jgi:hypothetical protein
MKTGELVAEIAASGTYWNTASNTVIVRCKRHDNVMVQCVYGESYVHGGGRVTTFCGEFLCD